MRRTVLFCLALLFVVTAASPYPRNARADSSNELLTYVDVAYDNLLKLDSFTASSDQVYQANLKLEALRLALDFNYQAKITSEVTPGDVFRGHARSDITMTSNMQPDPINVTTETFIDGDTVYARIDQGTLPQGDKSGVIAPGWVNKDLLPDDASPGYNGINIPSFFQLFGMNYVFVPGAVADVHELDPQEVDGQKMRVIEIVFTSLNLEASGMMDAMIEVFNGQAMGFTEDMTREMLSSSGYTFAVWIGEDDHLPHQFADFIEIESNITYMGYTATISGTMTTATNLTSINEPLTLTPPTLE